MIVDCKAFAATGSAGDGSAVVIIGAGTVGLAVAVRLAERRPDLRIICLESGPYNPADGDHPLNEVLHLQQVVGAASGRARGLGGTSTRWGGAMIPFLPADMQNADWPLPAAELQPFFGEVEKLFGLAPGPYIDPALGTPKLLARIAKWPTFRNRNVFLLLKDKIAALANLTLVTSATVCGWVRYGGGKVTGVRLKSEATDEITLGADQVIVCAGAIEATRLALLLETDVEAGKPGPNQPLGGYYCDHLSAPFADVEVREAAALNQLVGFRFEPNGTMRNLRFELREESPLRAQVPPFFAHIAFDTAGAGGFGALRDILRQVQKGRLPSPNVISQLLVSLPWLCRAVWWRYVRKRLLFPEGAKLSAHMVIEQLPAASNRVTLSRSKSDYLGMPLAEISWRVSEEDVDNFMAAVQIFEEEWARSDLSKFASLKVRSRAEIAEQIRSGSGIYHPTGTTRMGQSSESAVVDSDLRLFSAENVRIVATSVLPTGGGANPTMMLLALGLRCADQVAATAT